MPAPAKPPVYKSPTKPPSYAPVETPSYAPGEAFEKKKPSGLLTIFKATGQMGASGARVLGKRGVGGNVGRLGVHKEDPVGEASASDAFKQDNTEYHDAQDTEWPAAIADANKYLGNFDNNAKTFFGKNRGTGPREGLTWQEYFQVGSVRCAHVCEVGDHVATLRETSMSAPLSVMHEEGSTTNPKVIEGHAAQAAMVRKSEANWKVKLDKCRQALKVLHGDKYNGPEPAPSKKKGKGAPPPKDPAEKGKGEGVPPPKEPAEEGNGKAEPWKTKPPKIPLPESNAHKRHTAPLPPRAPPRAEKKA